MTGLYVDSLDCLVEMGVFLDPQDAIRDSLRRTFRVYGIEPFTDKGAKLETEKVPEAREIEGEAEEVPEDVESS